MGTSFHQRTREVEFISSGEKFCVFGLLLFMVLSFLFVMYLAATETPPPWYSVAIRTVSGLDLATDGRPLDPAFELTVRIDASLSGSGATAYCLPKSTSVLVSYLRVPLAAGRVPGPGDDTCATPWSRKDLAIVARGRGVAVPGFLLDSLAEDVRSGEAVFEVTLMSPGRGGWDVMTCWGKAGDDATLGAPCVKSWVKSGLPVPPPGGAGGGYGPVPRPRPGRHIRQYATL